MSIYMAKNQFLSRDHDFRFRYETLRSLLKKNGNALQIMSDLEADLNHISHYDERIKRPLRRLITETLLMAQELNLLTKDRYQELYRVIIHLRSQTDALFQLEEAPGFRPLAMMIDPKQRGDEKWIGGKAAGVWSLSAYFPDSVPPGFVITTAAYEKMLQQENLDNRIRLLLNDIDVMTDQDQFQLRTGTIRKWVREASIPKDVAASIQEFAARIEAQCGNREWAVRSSSVLEDSACSFAGQFATELKIDTGHLATAYKEVLASRFTDHAVKYRAHSGLREIDTPMAVLFMPMIEPVAAGVVYTSDVDHATPDRIVINSVNGVAQGMVRGEERADTFVLSKGGSPELIKTIPALDGENPAYISREHLVEIASMAQKAVEIFGHELDMEWAIDRNGTLFFLQARALHMNLPGEEKPPGFLKRKEEIPLLEGGITIFPGRSEGPLYFLKNEADPKETPEGAIVLVEKPRPELAVILPTIAGLLVMEGNPIGHLATLVREFSVPSIFRLGEKASILAGKNIVSVNATSRTVYAGCRWQGIRERALTRIASRKKEKKSGPLSDLVLRLNLINPDDASFKAESCESIHDALRFMHEMAVRSTFGFGDTHKEGFFYKGKSLQTDLPLKIFLIDLEKSVNEEKKKVRPEEVASTPFAALWRGISDQRVGWPERWEREMAGLPSDFIETVLGGDKGPRRASDRNYAIVAKDYLNLNARFSYHYAMVDAMVGVGAQNNHVHFRFRGGGASDANRIRRARFLERVLRASGFGVEQKQDLVTAWMRKYAKADSEKALEVIGRLMACARQLDVVLKHDSDVKRYAGYFLEGQYAPFS